MNVLMVEHFSPVNAYSEELIRELSHREDLTVMCSTRANHFQPPVTQLRKLYAGGANNKILALRMYAEGIIDLIKEVRSGKYQIIHVQTLKRVGVEMWVYRHRRKGTKLVYTVHNIVPHEAQDGDHNKELYGGVYNQCDALIVHNEECKRQLMGLYDIQENKIAVIPHGAYSVVPCKSIERTDEKTHFLMFGRILQYKGLDILLEAIALVPQEERRRMKFIIAGKQSTDQDATDYNKMVLDLGIADCVQLTLRRIEDDELPELFGWADACVFPYRQIYGSGALLMAYSYGKPVIASDVPVFMEETDNERTGLLFHHNDAESLSKQLIQYCSLPLSENERMRNDIQHLVETKYNWRISAKLTDDVYKDLVV